jgi:ApaG protein
MTIHNKISSGIKISVQVSLNEDISIIEQSRFFFNYQITIENNNPFAVQLLRRHWGIFDSLHMPRIVDGEGVIGLTPLLEPSQSFSYTSGCDLHSEIGFMEGYYTFLNLVNGDTFEVEIPRFDMCFYGKLN